MKALVVFLFALLTWAFTCSPCLAQAGFKDGGELYESSRLVKESCHSNKWRKGDAQMVAAIKDLRRKALAFTLSRSGGDLDKLWAIGMISTGWMSSYREFDDFESAHAPAIELLDAVRKSKPAEERLAVKTWMRMAQLHVQNWYREAPLAGAILFDEARAAVAECGDAGILEQWRFFAPSQEIAFMYSTGLPKAAPDRKQFKEQRERILLGYLNDTAIPLDKRTRDLWWWTVYMNTYGETAKAYKIMTAWDETYGSKIAEPLFYKQWMQMALFKDGDWDKARQMLLKVSAMAETGKIARRNDTYAGMSEQYFKLIFTPGFELKRLQAGYYAEYEAGKRARERAERAGRPAIADAARNSEER